MPHKVEGLAHKKVVQVAVGAMHCLALTDNGEVFSWGDNEHGQQGNGSLTANRKPQLITALKDHRITKIACGSSHCVAFAAGTPTATGEFSPVSFPASQDPLGSSLLVGRPDDGAGGEQDEMKRPSLTKIVLSLQTPAKQQEALGHMQTALQIAYARDAIVNSLGGVALAAQETAEDLQEEEGTSAVEITGVIPSSEISSLAGFSSTKQPEELEVPQSSDKVIPNFPLLARDLISFTHLLTVEDARVMVDLLKLAVARRVGTRGKETLGAVLTAMAKTNTEVATMLMELCINELEEVARSPRISETPQPILQESPHPYHDNCTYSNNIHMPGAEALILTFDPRCSTERRHDVLVIKDGSGAVIAVKSGRDTADWAQDIRVVGDELSWTFKSDGSVNGWGFRFTVNPILPKKVHGGSELSDRVLQSRPSVDLVTCLLDFQLGSAPTQESVSRLGAALASCAQLSTLGASQRMWAIQHFRKLLNSPTSGFLVFGAMGSCCPVKEAGGGSISPLISLMRCLPDALFKQFNYEIAHVTGGTQLQHSSFLQSLVLLGCDVELDCMESCSDSTKWTWFAQFCVAARMARAIQNRTPIPATCLAEVDACIESLTQPGEKSNRDHENNEIFKLEHDEQLLLWMQRYPKEWVIPLGIAFSVYGWGHNHRGQLGGVEGNKIKTPRLCEAFSELSPVKVTGGEQTMFAITKDGKVYASGYGAYGRLGIGGVDSVSTPTLITSFATRGIVVSKVACHSGGKHCLALTNNGEMYSWGEGDDGKLGHGGTANVDTPRFVDAMKGKRVVDAECGSSHSACILDDGSLYTWGKGRYGRLGHNDYETQYKPKQVMALKGEKIVAVACGSGDAHSLAASKETVFSWGDGDYGKLGRGGNEGSKVPKRVDSLSGKGVVKLMCGSQFSIALTTKNGHIYTWGKGDYYRLGHADDSHQRLPKRVMGPLANKIVVDVACGSLHCVCCTSNGQVFTWGDNDEGQIGNDSVTPVQGPQVCE
ncbi:E3 ubiquitin-protein ligase HERC2 [Geodia barretti]|nr:E3 ubiquitin-protein ligase HERC2 [Geodia barretti]